MSPRLVTLKPLPLIDEQFRHYGQIIQPSDDGVEYGPADAQLNLHNGIPRFYVMHLEARPLRFNALTHHAKVTQCLGSIGGKSWYLGVAAPSILDSGSSKKSVLSKCGHYYIPPPWDSIKVFKVEGPCFLKLHVGTWHAGPLFKEQAMDFYNLELSDTNVMDHTPYDFNEHGENLTFVIED